MVNSRPSAAAILLADESVKSLSPDAKRLKTLCDIPLSTERRYLVLSLVAMAARSVS